MRTKLIAAVLSLAFVPLMQSCNERQVARGAIAGAVVGGTIAAIADPTLRRSDRYYQHRYYTYYQPRTHYYSRQYRGAYSGRSYRPIERRYRSRVGRTGPRRGGTHGRWDNNVEVASVELQANSAEVQAVSNLFQVPDTVAAIIADAQNRAANGDLSGLAAIGIEYKDYHHLARNQKLPNQAIREMSHNLGISMEHARDIAEDFAVEFKALQATGRLQM